MKYLMEKLSSLRWKLMTKIWYSRYFGYIGKNVTFINPMLIKGERFISIGDDCVFRDGLRLEVVDHQEPVVIKIGSNVNVEQNVHIVGRGSIIIGDNVSITAGCSIVDVIHPLQDPRANKSYATVIDPNRHDVIIGDNTMIGICSHISAGVTIGKGCVIGAHSVVTKNIPDYCVCVGAPARVIKKFNFDRCAWEVIDAQV